MTICPYPLTLTYTSDFLFLFTIAPWYDFVSILDTIWNAPCNILWLTLYDLTKPSNARTAPELVWNYAGTTMELCWNWVPAQFQPSSSTVPVKYPLVVPVRFHCSSSVVPAWLLGWLLDWLKSSQTQSENQWQCTGTGMEAEVLGWNQKRTRVSVSPGCLYHSTETFLCLTLPGVKCRHKKSSTLNDPPKWVKWRRTKI